MIVSVLLDKLKERHKEYILVSETLELMSQANENCPIEHVKTYLLSYYIHHHTPVFYLDDYFRLAIDPSEESIRNFDGFNSTHHELTNNKVSDNAYFPIKSLNDFEPIQEFDIFAYKRGYHYIANHSVGKFTTGEKVIGLTEDRAIELLKTGAIKKRQINNENVVRQSKAPPPPNHINIAPTSQKIIDNTHSPNKENAAYQKRIADLEQQLANEKATDRFGMGTPKAEQCDPKTNEQLINDFRDQITQLTAENHNLNFRLSTARNTYEQHRNEIKALTEKNEQVASEKAELIEQLNRVEAESVDKPTDSATHSNTDIQNIKKAAIRQFNRSLAVALIDLDYQSNLRKGDIVNFIIPHMKELAYVLADEQTDKAKVLTVKYKTIYDTHLQGLEFKQGTQTTKERERVNIDLLFKKQLPVTE